MKTNQLYDCVNYKWKPHNAVRVGIKASRLILRNGLEVVLHHFLDLTIGATQNTSTSRKQ